MVNSLLKIEKIGQVLLRIGIAVYLVLSALSIILGGFSAPLWQGLLVLAQIIFAVLLLGHYRFPKAGIIGAIGCLLFFIFKGITISILLTKTDTPTLDQLFSPILQYLLLIFGTVILLGESIKEMIRQRITQPFPKR